MEAAVHAPGDERTTAQDLVALAVWDVHLGAPLIPDLLPTSNRLQTFDAD
jgi:hypothetical protein